MAGRPLDGQPFSVFDDQVHALQGLNGAPAFLVVPGDAGELVHQCPSVIRWFARPCYPGRERAPAGRRRTARQPPNVPATKPPTIARATARPTAPSVTGAVRW